MRKISFKQVLSKHPKPTKKSPHERWLMLKEYVRQGKFKTFLTKDTRTLQRSKMTHENKTKGLHLPLDYKIDDDDCALDKFTKLVTIRIHQMREEKQSCSTTGTGADGQADTQHVNPDLRKDREAYETAIRCVLTPLLEHNSLHARSNSSLAAPNATPSAANQASQFKIVLEALNDMTTPNTHKISPQIFQKLRDRIKAVLREAPKDVDYSNSLYKIYNQVMKRHSLTSISYDDLIRVFQTNLRLALPDEDISARVLTLVDLIKNIVEECDAQVVVKPREHRRMFSQPMQKSTASFGPVLTSGSAGKTHQREGSLLAGKEAESSVDEEPELAETTSSHAMTEWLKDSFMFGRTAHLSITSKFKTHLELEILEKELSDRVKEIDADTIHQLGLFTYGGIAEEAFPRPEVFYNWRKQEKQQLLKHINHLKALSPQPEDAAASGLESGAKEIKLRVKVVEARGLAVKDEDGGSDPYVVVEYGDQRYQTDVVADSLMPLWDQEVSFLMKVDSKKTLRLNVWDKDEVDPSVFSTKFWKDEADDFLGMLEFKIPQILEELGKSQEGKVDKWYVLQKRSMRSHVSGDIRVVFSVKDDSGAGTSGDSLKKEEALKHVTSAMKLELFENYEGVYAYVLEKLLSSDSRQTTGELGEGSLCAASQAILDEIGERYRLSKIQRELLYFQMLTGRLFTPTASELQVPVKTLLAAYNRLDGFMRQAKNGMKHVKLVCPVKIDYAPDGTKIVNPPIVTGFSELQMTLQEAKTYGECLRSAKEGLSGMLQRYKDSFPCDTPSGELVAALGLMHEICENEFAEKEFDLKATTDNTTEDLTAVTSEKAVEVDFAEELMNSIKMGCMDRFMMLAELASPMKQNACLRLVKLADLIMEELDADLTYFQRPFSADLNVVGVSAEVYLKYYMLEVETFVSTQTPLAYGQGQKSKPAASNVVGSEIFELYYRVRTLQEKYLPLLDASASAQSSPGASASSAVTLQKEFSMHRWFCPCIQTWLLASEPQLLEWVKAAVSQDSFEHVDEEAGVLNSTSVGDLFGCFSQLRDCLGKLEWCKAGGGSAGYSSTDSGFGSGNVAAGTDHEARLYEWCLFMTQYSRIVSKAMSLYCTLLSEQIMQARFQSDSGGKHKSSAAGDGATSLDIALGSLGLGHMGAKSKESLTGASESNRSLNRLTTAAVGSPAKGNEWLVKQDTTRGICVRVNNLEAARTQLNEIYDMLDVDTLQAVMNRRREGKHDNVKEAQFQGKGVTGYLSFKIVQAENLVACDSNGKSDPYCVITVKQHSKDATKDAASLLTEKKIAKTKIVSSNLNPRWDESFTTYLRNAASLAVVVFDYDHIGKDDVCGNATLEFESVEKVLSDAQTHDLWVDLKPQGKVLLRLSLEKQASADGGLGLVDLDFYFRRTFRELKRCAGDLVGLVAESIAQSVKKDLVKILKEAEKTGRQGAGGDTGFSLMTIFGSSQQDKGGANHEAVAEEAQLVSEEQVANAIEPVTAYLDEALNILNCHLFPRLTKDLLKRTWKELLNVAESFMLPPLFGDVLLGPLGRTKPLTQRQLEMLWKSVEVFKAFLNGDGVVGLALSVLESRRYAELKHVVGMYWQAKTAILEDYQKLVKVIGGDGEDGGGGDDVDLMLKLVRLRFSDSKQGASMFQDTLLAERAMRQSAPLQVD